jgi:hypothetical protein
MFKSFKMDLKIYIIPYISINVFKWKNITTIVIFLFQVNGFKNIDIANG